MENLVKKECSNILATSMAQSKYWTLFSFTPLKGCVRYIFSSVFFKPKKQHLWNKENVYSNVMT